MLWILKDLFLLNHTIQNVKSVLIFYLFHLFTPYNIFYHNLSGWWYQSTVKEVNFEQLKNLKPANSLDMKNVKGQFSAKRALEIAAAGGHNILMIGPPGSGKTMLAKCFPSILPEMTFEEALEVTKIHSIAGELDLNDGIILTRPFRTPHHTASTVSLVGGGNNSKPGEISLAHNGVLFLDELPEFNRNTLEVLRGPLEDRKVSISRVNASVTYPCNFMLIASMNFSLYYKIWRGDWQAFKNDTEHRYYLALLAFAGLAIAFDLYNAGYMDITSSLRHGMFQAISIGSTTGFASDDFNNWPSFSRFVLLILMFIGGCSGSTAGGMKISRVVILLKASWAELLRTLHPRIVYSIKMGGTVIDPAILGNITRFFFLYIIVFMVLTIAISLPGISIMESIGIIATCLSSAGPAFGIVGPTSTYSEISTFGRIVTICAMLLGRLEIFTLLVILRPDFWRNKQNW